MNLCTNIIICLLFGGGGGLGSGGGWVLPAVQAQMSVIICQNAPNAFSGQSLVSICGERKCRCDAWVWSVDHICMPDVQLMNPTPMRWEDSARLLGTACTNGWITTSWTPYVGFVVRDLWYKNTQKDPKTTWHPPILREIHRVSIRGPSSEPFWDLQCIMSMFLLWYYSHINVLALCIFKWQRKTFGRAATGSKSSTCVAELWHLESSRLRPQRKPRTASKKQHAVGL